MDTTLSADPNQFAKELGPAAEAPIGPCIGIASIALNMAMKYHDINMIRDGALYQQYKLEGRNMRDLHLDMVFETAMRIEQHLIAANKRVAAVIVASALDIEAEEHGPDKPPSTEDDADALLRARSKE